MNFQFAVNVSISLLYNGCRSFYASVAIGNRRLFVSRWDTERVTLKPGQIDIWRGPIMTWYAGSWKPKIATALLLCTTLAIGACGNIPTAPGSTVNTCAPFGSAQWHALNEQQAAMYLANGRIVNAEQSAIVAQMCHEPIAIAPIVVSVPVSEMPIMCGAAPCNVLPGFTCETKPRAYILADGTVSIEIDHYKQTDPCPQDPID